jgi:hypothetical protein
MSSGACRALVALLFTLVATGLMALPVVAETERLNEQSVVTYKVDPRDGSIDVEITLRLEGTNPNQAVPAGSYGPIYVEERTQPGTPRVRGIPARPTFSEAPGPWREMFIEIPRIPPGEVLTVPIRYSLRAGLDQDDTRLAATPARVSTGYVYVCAPGQDSDLGSIEIEVRTGARFVIDQSGTPLVEEGGTLQSELVPRPVGLFTCIEATRQGRLESETLIGPDEREIVLQAWPSDRARGWLDAAEENATPVLDELRAFLGQEIPGEGPIIIRQAPNATLGGYASAHDQAGVVQLDERAGVFDPEHELAHVWFNADLFREQWLREGLAEWTASSLQGEACAPVADNETDVELGDWKVVQPSSPDTIEQQIADQEAAACGIVAAMQQRMTPELWNAAIGSLLRGETKYLGSAGPGVAATPTVTYRQFLDAMDERGLVPSAAADPAFAGNLDDLDFAQNLVEAFGADVQPLELIQRAATRERYHQFLADAAPLAAPLAVRKAMEDWNFNTANAQLDKSYEVFEALTEAVSLLPEADIFPIIQPDFEAAPDAATLDAVLADTLVLLEEAQDVFTPLAELRAVTPTGWQDPVAIRRGLAAQNFDTVRNAIAPAILVVERIQSADRVLPQADLLATYQAAYEEASSPGSLEDLAAALSTITRQAEQAGIGLELLRSEVGEWQIPAAVTEPLETGQLGPGLLIINDARAVVSAARDADLALPQAELASEIRPRFEAVTSAAEMSRLKADAELRRGQAQAIGGALNALEQRAPEWVIPAVITQPIEDRDFETAAEVAAVAEQWIEDASEAEEKLPELGALETAKDEFESASTLADLQTGAGRAANQNVVASRVAEARDAVAEDRDLLAGLGLMGVDVDGPMSAAIAAAIEGDVEASLANAAKVIDTINSAQASGGLRLAGIVFLGVALMGVLGLWLVMRREAGPPWARQSTPHWVDKKDSRWRRRGK